MELPSFSDQIWLIIIDKLLLGSVAVIVGAIAARSLERYKTRNALIQSTASQRIDALHQLVQSVGEVFDMVEGLVRDLHDEMCADLGVDPKTGTAVSGVGPSFWGNVVAFDTYLQALTKARRARIEEVETAIDQLDKEIRKKRFWIGGSTASDLRRDLREFRSMLKDRSLRALVLALYLSVRHARSITVIKFVSRFVPYWPARWSHTNTIDEAIRRLAR